MIIGERIEARLGELRMSQSELARRLGFRQSTINGLIKGDQRSTTKLPQLARELQTTPEYLTGESDDPAATSHSPPPMSSERRELLDCFDRLDRADQLALLQIARSMGGDPEPPPRLHAHTTSFRGEGDS
ncbi:hypothetical protein CA223_05375 [Sphingomonas koreensis]|uniref:Helix-turn-helix domain-containing protein n=1 Tax=Sphingomonas koreensis TaxID=93064 RepID=A0AAJ4V8N7_9SPHN|nr:helix-turn-helix domain-containing protein [Sphingomonas koreensis]MDC7809961.1 helix-turn-helix domain-containing protein [Sphingomonas koreensis]RSU24533.1 hypothetical protein CA224_02105 [Sphingomonas koreensis]RSU25178.1 hypothetical protein CA222_13700 [Sphingomonas koreensis]RSU30147.1 hypothetical protein CA225_05650 [Sphingomonas koreensis]RSU37416.1 hypothetical protein BRX39_05875 [Sphingomonas koreensis]